MSNGTEHFAAFQCMSRTKTVSVRFSIIGRRTAAQTVTVMRSPDANVASLRILAFNENRLRCSDRASFVTQEATGIPPFQIVLNESFSLRKFHNSVTKEAKIKVQRRRISVGVPPVELMPILVGRQGAGVCARTHNQMPPLKAATEAQVM